MQKAADHAVDRKALFMGIRAEYGISARMYVGPGEEPFFPFGQAVAFMGSSGPSNSNLTQTSSRVGYDFEWYLLPYDTFRRPEGLKLVTQTSVEPTTKTETPRCSLRTLQKS